ncbi:MAG: hypothetical protein ILO53_02365 [Clostridia bacterium]|nr:hypothetical protein [Clostridia bacterium]
MAAIEYKCPNCAAPLVYDPGAKVIKCEFCDSTFDPEELGKIETTAISHETAKIDDEYIEGEKAEEYWKAIKAKTAGYTCSSCGGAIIGTVDSAALFCPYCGNPAVIQSSLSGEFAPDFIIPFTRTKEEAVEAYKAFVGKGQKVLPKAFQDNHAVEKVTGIYIPYHLMSCDASASCKFTSETTEKWSDNTYDYEKTNFFSNARAGRMAFDRIPSDASSSIDDDFMESLEPFDYGGLKPFEMSYLSGFLADKYDLGIEECSKTLDVRVESTIYSELRKTVENAGYKNIAQKSAEINIFNRKYSYALLPVWLLRTRFNNEFYYFAMNGQTGKTAGRLPVDSKKVSRISFGYAALAFLIVLAIFVIVNFSAGAFFAGILIGALVALITGLITRSNLTSKVRNVIRQGGASNYVSGSLKLSVREDVFTDSKTSRKLRKKES